MGQGQQRPQGQEIYISKMSTKGLRVSEKYLEGNLKSCFNVAVCETILVPILIHLVFFHWSE